MTHKEQKSKSIESNPEVSQTIESVDKDVHVFEKLEKRPNVLEMLRPQTPAGPLVAEATEQRGKEGLKSQHLRTR